MDVTKVFLREKESQAQGAIWPGFFAIFGKFLSLMKIERGHCIHHIFCFVIFFCAIVGPLISGIRWLMSSTWRYTLSQTFVFGQGLFQTISRYLLELPQQQKALQVGEGSSNDSPSPKSLTSFCDRWEVRFFHIFPCWSKGSKTTAVKKRWPAKMLPARRSSKTWRLETGWIWVNLEWIWGSNGREVPSFRCSYQFLCLGPKNEREQ